MAKYATEPGTYEVIKVGSAGYEYLFDDVGRKSKRRVRLAKGSRIYFRELPKYGSIRVAKTAVGFMTANLEYVKKV